MLFNPFADKDFQPPRGESTSQRRVQVDRTIAALYRWYVSCSQSRRNWNPDTSFRWREIGQSHAEDVLKIIQGFYAVEQFIPDYTAELVGLVRRDYGRSQFYLRWGAEEAKHADLWRNTLLATGYRTLEELESYTTELRERSWELPFEDPLEMLIYTVFQERATQISYHHLRRLAASNYETDWGRVKADPVLANVAKTIAQDEVAHFEFYLSATLIHLYYFPERTLNALARVLAFFEMPAAKIIPDYAAFIEALYSRNLFGRRIYVCDVVKLIQEKLAVRDSDSLNNHVKAKRPPAELGRRYATLDSLPGPSEVFDFEVVQQSIITLFWRLCRFERDEGIDQLFETELLVNDWDKVSA